MKLQEFLDSIGVETPLDQLKLDNTMNYLKDPAGFNGWYRGYVNKFGTFLQFGDWREPNPEVFKEDPTIPTDPLELEAWKKEQKSQAEADAKHVLEVQERVSRDTLGDLTQFSKEGQSLYLITKGVHGWGVYYRFPSKSNAKETDLIVPVRDVNEKLWGYQVISPFGDKDFIPGGRLGGCFHLLGEKIESVVYVAEGYATAASVFEATGKPTLCAFNAGNIPKVCKAVREKYPKVKIVIAADNDDAGLSFAKQAAAESGAVVVAPHKKEGKLDFNDLHKRDGKEKVQKLLVGVSIEPKNRAHILSAGELLDEPDEDIEYLVDKLLPRGGTSVLAGQPKVGKTTLVRDLLRCIGEGKDFLNRRSTKGKVLYLALEEKRSFLRQKMKKFSPEALKNMFLTFRISPTDRLDELRRIVEQLKPDLIVIDTMYKFIRVDEETYGEMVQVLAPLEELARESGAHIMLVHHAKKGESKGVESVLGSTAIAGAVDTIITIRKAMVDNTEQRVLAATNRYGDDIDESVFTYDKETEVTSIKEVPSGQDSYKDKVLKFFKGVPDQWLAPKDIKEAFGGGYEKIKNACYELSKEGALQFKRGDKGGSLYMADPKWFGTPREGDPF